MARISSLLLAVCLFATPAWTQFAQPNGGDLETGVLPEKWMTGGPKCMEIPEWQVHEYNPNLFILRQSGCTDAEMSFLYLFFGKDSGLLWDTGSRRGNLVPTLQHVVHDWLERNHRDQITLVVTHSHSHEDHVFGDAAVKAINDPAIKIQFVAPTVSAASAFFGIGNWPSTPGQVDLGQRVLNVIPIPGHDDYAIAIYDRRTGVLLTGDNLYPGRLYVKDFGVYKASTERLIAFLNDQPVAHILGNHIEQTQTPFKDFPIGSIYHPQEHCLELTMGTLLELEDGLKSMDGAPRRLATRDFTIWPIDPKEHGLGLEMDQIFKQTQAEQIPNKWNQPGH